MAARRTAELSSAQGGEHGYGRMGCRGKGGRKQRLTRSLPVCNRGLGGDSAERIDGGELERPEEEDGVDPALWCLPAPTAGTG